VSKSILPNAEARLCPFHLGQTNILPKQLLDDLQSFDNLIDVFPREFLIINWNNIPPQESKPELHQLLLLLFFVNIK
jgi:hypothetical protein